MNEMTFEEAMMRLNQITQELEKSDIPLEKSISLFEEGLKLSKFCDDKLRNYEAKIESLTATMEGESSED